MFSTASGPPFVIVMVVMVGIASSLQKEIPVCEPPAPSCSLFQRTVCEWSAANEPVWACRGLFESATDGPDTAQDADPDVVLGTYEYQLPLPNVSKGSSKQDSEDSDETDIKYVTFTYPIATKVKKNGASQVESKSEVRIESSVNTSSARSSTVSKSESGSEISTGRYSLPVSSSKSSVVGETSSNVKFETHSRKTGAATNTLISTADKNDSNVETKTRTENLLPSTRTSDVVSEGLGSTVQAVAEVQTSKNASVAHEKSTSAMGTKNSSSSAGKVDEANTHVQMDTVKYEALADNSKSTSREESVSGSKNIESESESSVLGAHNYKISSDKQISSSQEENHSSIQSAAHSTGNGSDVLSSSSTTVAQADTLTSSSESTTSRSNSEDDVQFFGTHQLSSREKSSAKRDYHQSVTSDSASRASTEVQPSSEVAFSGANPGTSDRRRQYTGSADRSSVACERNQEQRIQTNQASSVQGLQSSSMFDDTTRSLVLKNLDSQTNWGSYYQRNSGYDSDLANQQYKSWMNKYAWAYRRPGPQDFTGNADYVHNGQWSLGRGYESPGGSSHTENHGFPTNGVVSADYHDTATDYNIASLYQQYKSNSVGGSGMAPQFGDSVAENRFPLSYPYYGYSGYQSSQQAYPAPTHFATFGNVYPWPLSWGAQPNSAAYGSQWMGLNTLVASQSESPSVNSGLYGLQSLNSGPGIPSSNSALYAMPYAQHVIASLCPCCDFCKKLMSIFGGTEICDAVQPVILECYSKILEIIRNRLN